MKTMHTRRQSTLGLLTSVSAPDRPAVAGQITAEVSIAYLGASGTVSLTPLLRDTDWKSFRPAATALAAHTFNLKTELRTTPAVSPSRFSPEAETNKQEAYQ